MDQVFPENIETLFITKGDDHENNVENIDDDERELTDTEEDYAESDI